MKADLFSDLGQRLLSAPEFANRIQAFIGSLVSDEYDMEGTAETATNFDAFFIRESDGRKKQSVN